MQPLLLHLVLLVLLGLLQRAMAWLSIALLKKMQMQPVLLVLLALLVLRQALLPLAMTWLPKAWLLKLAQPMETWWLTKAPMQLVLQHLALRQALLQLAMTWLPKAGL